MTEGKVKILIVDDKPEKILALEAVLEDLGQTIVRAYSGREALRCLLNEEFAVILLDVNMPGMDGFETAAMIRQRHSTQHVPIIFVTAFGDENHSNQGYSLGAVDYIQTPVVPDVLKTKVSVFVDLFKKTEQVRRQAEWLQRRASQLHKLTAASLSINSALSIEKLLSVVTDAAREILMANHGSATIMPDQNWAHDGTIVSQAPAAGTGSAPPSPVLHQQQRGGRPQAGSLRAMVCEMNKPLRLTREELEVHPGWHLEHANSARGGGGTRPGVVRGWMGAPLIGRDGRNIGLLEVSDKLDGGFTDDDEAVLMQLAQMASIAIENTILAQERETNRIKDEFLSTLSHELRTPLNAIVGWTQLLAMDPTPEQVPHGLEVIERNAKAQAKLIEDLLDVSRVTTGKLRLNCKPLKLSQVVEAAVDAVRPVADDKGVELVWNGAMGDDATSGDADRLQQVVWNLLSNAIKFTPRGQKVEVRLDSYNAHLRLTVIDTGMGIPSTFLPHVFDRFRQADSSSTRSHGGLGIGLTIVRHIVELHGGTVRAESAGEGHGSTFTVMLPPPVAAIAGTGGDRRASSSASATPVMDLNSPPDLKGVRVLIVDDEVDALDVVARTLKHAGADVHASSTVADAISAAGDFRPDVIVSDIAMPDEDGFDFIRKVRAMGLGNGHPTPAVALTAYARDEDKAKVLSAGFTRHLAKPVQPGELLATVWQLTAKSGAPGAAGAAAGAHS